MTKRIDSLGPLPDEIQLQIAEQLKPYELQEAAKAGIVPVPLTGDLQKRAQHAHVWATILSSKDFALFERIFTDTVGNAYLIGTDLKYLYHGISGLAEDTPSPMHLFLTWDSDIHPRLNPKLEEIYWNMRIVYIESPQVIVYIKPYILGPPCPVDDLKDFVDPDTLQSHVVYFRDSESALRDIQFKLWSNLHGVEKYLAYLDSSMIAKYDGEYFFDISYRRDVTGKE